MIRLRRLEPGDRVALVAPASSFPPEEVEAGVAELARLGLEAVYDPSIFDKERFVAGSVQTRVDAIHKAWADPGIAALIAMRGGYGSAQLLPLLDTQLLRSSCKPLIGYSDITALLSLYLQNGLTAIHGPMIDRRLSKGPDAYHEDSFRRVVMTAEPAGDLRPDRLETLASRLRDRRARRRDPHAVDGVDGHAVGVRGAGGLRAVPRRHRRASVSHPSSADTSRAGRRVARARAIVFGEFPGCDEPGGDPAIKDVLREFTADFRGPVLFNFPSGHTTGPTWTLPFGVRAEVTAAPSPVVRILEAAVHNGMYVRYLEGVRSTHAFDSMMARIHLDWRRRHRDGHAGGDAETSRPRRERIRRACLSADERLPCRRTHYGARRVSTRARARRD